MAIDETDKTVKEGDLLRSVDLRVKADCALTAFVAWLGSECGLSFNDYRSLWRFSIDELERFWALWMCYFDPGFATGALGQSAISGRGFDPAKVLSSRVQPQPRWFEGLKLNYARYALSANSGDVAVVAYGEGDRVELTYSELSRQVALLAAYLRDIGVQPGDRVAAYLPNSVFALVGFLASASIGAIWSSCSPDFGASAVVDRFAQIEPKVLLCVLGYSYGGKWFDRRGELGEIVGALGELVGVVFDGDGSGLSLGASVAKGDFSSIVSVERPAVELDFEEVGFSHPLWILYSSGTTGLPKAIVQSHGGILIEHSRVLALHCDIRAGDRFMWYTTTGWMMWNFLVSGLLVGSTIVLVDGSIAYPDLYRLYEIVAAERITYFGTSAPFINACEKAAIVPRERFDLGCLRTLGSTGAPLSRTGFAWVYENVSASMQLASVSGGTDVCTAFLASTPWHETRAGELSCATLGANVKAFDEDGVEVVDEVGELVICDPMPSMPIELWKDPGAKKLRAAYFSKYPGIWRHGDWIKIKASGSAVIYGRSDSTLNRGGIRMGTAEFYAVVESVAAVQDSLVIDTSRLEGEGELWLFVVMSPNAQLSSALSAELKRRIREDLSPRHVPDRVVQVADIPRTINGKKMEVPIKRILLGESPESVLSTGSMANPAALAEFIDLSGRLK